MICNRKHIYNSILDIPENKIGAWEIKHDNRGIGAEFSLSTTRTQIFQGDRGGKVRFEMPTRWHKLLEKNGIWMSDYPIEQYQHDELLKDMKGNVLVGGLGLGYAATFLCLRKHVTSVTVIEKSSEVIKLVGKHLLKDQAERKKLTIICEDLFAYLQKIKDIHFTYDYGFYDIWAGDGENTFFQTVCPLYALSWKKVRHLRNWNEGCMRGQLYHSLQGRLWTVQGKFGQDHKTTAEELSISTGDIWHDWTATFFRWYLRHLTDGEDYINYAIQSYVGLYGTKPTWEKHWETIFH